MAGSIDLWGCMIIVFVIVAGMVVVIKLLLEFPGLLQWKCVYSEHEHEHERENVGPPYLRRDLELGRAQSPRVKHSLDKSSSRVMETEMVEMGRWWSSASSRAITALPLGMFALGAHSLMTHAGEWAAGTVPRPARMRPSTRGRALRTPCGPGSRSRQRVAPPRAASG